MLLYPRRLTDGSLFNIFNTLGFNPHVHAIDASRQGGYIAPRQGSPPRSPSAPKVPMKTLLASDSLRFNVSTEEVTNLMQPLHAEAWSGGGQGRGGPGWVSGGRPGSATSPAPRLSLAQEQIAPSLTQLPVPLLDPAITAHTE